MANHDSRILPATIETPKGWPVVAAATIGLAAGLSPVPFYTIGMLAPELARSFHWSFAALMGSITVQSLTVIISSPLAGLAVDRFGARPVALVSLVLFGLCYMSLAFTPGVLWVYYAQWFVMSMLGGGTLPGTWTRVVNGWFDRNLGLALGVTSTGTGIAGFLLKPYAAWLIQNFGWRGAILGIGLIPIVIAVPVVAWLFVERGESGSTALAAAPADEPGLELHEAVRTRQFWVMAFGFLLIATALTAPTPNMENILRSMSFGLPVIARITASFGLAVIAGRLVGGWLLDRIWAPAAAFGILLLPAAGSWLLAQPHIGETSAWLAVISLGLAAGFEFDLLAFLIVRYFGRRRYGTIYGCFYVVIAVGGATGPVLFGRIYDVTGTYSRILMVGAVCILCGGGVLLGMGKYPAWKTAQAAG
jgi:MFS family permease